MYGFGLSLVSKMLIGSILITVVLGLMAWVVHSISSGAAAKVELENVRNVARHNAQKASELSAAYDRKSKAEATARVAVQQSEQAIAKLAEQLQSTPAKQVESQCNLDCQLPVSIPQE